MNPFVRRYFTADEIRGAAATDLNDRPEAIKAALANFPGSLPSQRLTTEWIVRLLDHVLGTHVTNYLLSGNTPTVLLTAGNLFEDHLCRNLIQGKDLQLNLLVNIFKECAYVEGVQLENAQEYLRGHLTAVAVPEDLCLTVLATLTTNDQFTVPWTLIQTWNEPAAL